MVQTPSPETLVIGVDIGGTKVAAAVVGPGGSILHRARVPMVSSNGAAAGLASVTSAIESVSDQLNPAGVQSTQIRGIGICSPGPLNPKTGIVLNPPNLPCWRDYPLAAEVARLYPVRVTLDNDANAAGLAEAIWGAGRGNSNVFYATVGTGIGTAILIDGHIYHGRTGAAGEGGHLSIDYRGPRCACGKLGCIEALAAGPAIARRAKSKLGEGRSSRLMDLTGGDVDRVTSDLVGQANSAGDALAHEVIQETLQLLAVWLGNVIDLLEPDIIVIGGGVASMLKPYFWEIQDRLPACCVNQRCGEIPIVPANFGEDAGIIGAAALCFHGA
jgi:glucokinase